VAAAGTSKGGQAKPAPTDAGALAQAKGGPVRKEEPRPVKPDPLAQPEAYARRPLEATRPAAPPVQQTASK
jgi:hypothetical protein